MLPTIYLFFFQTGPSFGTIYPTRLSTELREIDPMNCTSDVTLLALFDDDELDVFVAVAVADTTFLLFVHQIIIEHSSHEK